MVGRVRKWEGRGRNRWEGWTGMEPVKRGREEKRRNRREEEGFDHTQTLIFSSRILL